MLELAGFRVQSLPSGARRLTVTIEIAHSKDGREQAGATHLKAEIALSHRRPPSARCLALAELLCILGRELEGREAALVDQDSR